MWAFCGDETECLRKQGLWTRMRRSESQLKTSRVKRDCLRSVAPRSSGIYLCVFGATEHTTCRCQGPMVKRIRRRVRGLRPRVFWAETGGGRIAVSPQSAHPIQFQGPRTVGEQYEFNKRIFRKCTFTSTALRVNALILNACPNAKPLLKFFESLKFE